MPTSDPIQDLIRTARFYHSFHRWYLWWACPGCRILARIPRERVTP